MRSIGGRGLREEGIVRLVPAVGGTRVWNGGGQPETEMDSLFLPVK